MVVAGAGLVGDRTHFDDYVECRTRRRPAAPPRPNCIRSTADSERRSCAARGDDTARTSRAGARPGSRFASR